MSWLGNRDRQAGTVSQMTALAFKAADYRGEALVLLGGLLPQRDSLRRENVVKPVRIPMKVISVPG